MALNEKIRIGIAGYGNLGRGSERAVAKNADMELAGVFTRRSPGDVVAELEGTRVFGWDSLTEHEASIDVMILCGGSKEDLPRQGPELAARFNTVDSFGRGPSGGRRRRRGPVHAAF